MDEQTLTKKEIRARVRMLRRQMTPEELLSESRKIFDKVRTTEGYRSARSIFAYMAMPGEIQTRDFIGQAWKDGKRVAVPRTDMEAHQIRFYYIEDFGQTEPGVMGIQEPSQVCTCADPEREALIIMPGVAFDRDRHRIGYGGGFYDRYLEAHPDHPTMAVALPFQIFDRIPAERHDRKPDKVITPNSTI